MPAALRIGALASLAAGAIHATASGTHGDARRVIAAFALVAVAQIGWGVLAMMRSGRLVSLAGVAVNGAVLGGWVLAKTRGIGFIDGLDAAEDPAFADTLAAGLAVVAIAGAGLALLRGARWVSRPYPGLVGVAAVAAVSLAVPGMVATGGHDHPGGDVDAGGHAAGAHDMAGMDHGAGGAGHGGEEAAAPRPYDATLPVDLGGVPGVSAEEEAEAEAVVTASIERLPQFADWTTLADKGWYSIHDAFAPGQVEHFMNWPLIADDKVLDPDAPESLVFEWQPDGSKKLVAAMYMADRGTPLDAVPDVGGKLVQWHIHDNLCFMGEENQWVVGGVSPPDQPCRPGTFRFEEQTPMVHVWITPHPCGPFAALEGIAGGQIQPGEERLCDHAHGSDT
ncbi:MAG TPA: hypothetical protein VFI47_04315 [Acidimicrobiales bacterium]|nr:hypothetical protein [Acidimicrobiales bacterium]